MASNTGKAAPPAVKYCKTNFPYPGVLIVSINRPKQLNSLTVEANFELDSLFRWFEREPSLRVAIITGVGKAFCVGADIKEWISNQEKGVPFTYPDNGFGGLSLRQGTKPIIAAVNGPAHGGGCEMVLNCDLVVAARSATFALPEVRHGVAPIGGSLARLIRTMGRQLATELALTGRAATAEEFKSYGICNAVTEDGPAAVARAMEFATCIVDGSPEAVKVTREGLRLGWESLGVGEASRVFLHGWSRHVYGGEDMQEGLRAFIEKRPPRWKSTKL